MTHSSQTAQKSAVMGDEDHALASLAQLLEMVARGIRSTRALEEVLRLSPRSLRALLLAARWLDLVGPAPEPVLTLDGLTWVYAGPRRAEIFAQVVHQRPAIRLLTREVKGRMLLAPDIHAELAQQRFDADPDLHKHVISVLTELIVHALGFQTEPSPADQLSLPLVPARGLKNLAPVEPPTARSFSPDVYRHLLCALLDYGELTLAHVRALLDRVSRSPIPVGPYLDLATSRGDALRTHDRLIVTPAAVTRRFLAISTPAVILSDHGWRNALEQLRHGTAQTSTRAYRSWFRRLFGHDPDPARLDLDLERVLADRSLDAFPLAAHATAEPTTVHKPFLEASAWRGLVLTLPSSLAKLWEGVEGLNEALRHSRARAGAIEIPDLTFRPQTVHGALLHPGETPPRAIADNTALRLRIASHAPYPAMLVALLFHERGTSAGLGLRRRDHQWLVYLGRRSLGPLVEMLDAFAIFRGWHPARLLVAGLGADSLVHLLIQRDILVQSGLNIHLHDGFFQSLQEHDPVSAQRLHQLSLSLATWAGRTARAPSP